MAYEIHIERQDGTPIAAGEWAAAVEAQSDMRLANGRAEATNDETGARIAVPGDGDVEVRIGDGWLRAFSLRRGRGHFNATADFEDPESHLRRAARRLARSLNAQLVGDEGETYP